MIKRMIFCCAMATGCLSVVSCSSSPTSRIEENRAVYESLTPQQRALVADGKLAKGMSPAAVLLAWGEPVSKMTGNVNGKATERWMYRRDSGWSFGLGAGGFHGNNAGFGTGLGMSVPLGGSAEPAVRSVLFEKGVVIGWEGVTPL